MMLCFVSSSILLAALAYIKLLHVRTIAHYLFVLFYCSSLWHWWIQDSCSIQKEALCDKSQQLEAIIVIISCSTCCLVGPVKATWVCASFDSNLVIISCSTCCLIGPVKATWVCASFDSNLFITSCSTCCLDCYQAGP